MFLSTRDDEMQGQLGKGMVSACLKSGFYIL